MSRFSSAALLLFCALLHEHAVAGQLSLSLQIDEASREDRRVTVVAGLAVEPTSVARLSGLGFRLCWSPARNLALSAFVPTLDAPAAASSGGYRWVGGADSLAACVRHEGNSLGLPMAWIDWAAAWPPSASQELGRLTLTAPGTRFSGRAEVWVEPTGLPAGQTLSTTGVVFDVRGTLVFEDGFERR